MVSVNKTADIPFPVERQLRFMCMTKKLHVLILVCQCAYYFSSEVKEVDENFITINQPRAPSSKFETYKL